MVPRPLGCESGRPLSAIAFETWHADHASVSGPPGVRDRRAAPMLDL